MLLEIPGYPDYMVSDSGEVISTLNNDLRSLSQSQMAGGYMVVKLRDKDGRFRTNYVHRLVALAFHHNSDPSCKRQVRHLNGNKLDNRAENLAFGTAKENAEDARRHGTLCVGENSPFSVLTESMVRRIKVLWKEEGLTLHKIAAMYRVSFSTIQGITSGKSWKHVS